MGEGAYCCPYPDALGDSLGGDVEQRVPADVLDVQRAGLGARDDGDGQSVTAVWLSSLAGGAYWPPAVALMVISALGIWCTLRLRAHFERRVATGSTAATRETAAA